MSRISHLDQGRHLDDPQLHQVYVTEMFEEIAPRYDAFTRLFSFGMDAVWKRDLADLVAKHAPPQARLGLDLACGTGDLAVAVAQRLPAITVTGIDVAAEMIARAHPHPQVSYRQGDASRPEAAPGSLGVVTVGYGLRNFTDHRPTLAAISTALAPGGILAILDFTRPAFAPWRWIFLGYLWLTGTLVGWWWHRHGPVYSYIARSINRFVSRRQLLEQLAAVGLVAVHEGSHLGGGVCVLIVKKQP